MKIVFLVGQIPNTETQARINEESQLNNDVVQESFFDTYNNLTLKTVMMLKWVNSNCIDKGLFFSFSVLRTTSFFYSQVALKNALLAFSFSHCS